MMTILTRAHRLRTVANLALENKLMKIIATALCIIAAAGLAGGGEIKVATVDLQRLLKEYYRAEEISKQLEARHNAVFKELAELRLEGDRLLKEAHDLQERSLDLALSETARSQTKRSFELKLADFRAFELSYDQTRGQREAEFQNQAVAANKRILDEILTRTRSIGEAGGFNLLLNASKLNPASSDVVFSKDIDDITEKVLASLNATRTPSEKSSAPLQPEHR
jgi:Skp family chaperone for outer membrane proteins